MSGKLALGLDFGSLSGRILLVDLASGAERASVACPYQHGFIDQTLPETGERLPPDWCLQEPADYLDVLRAIPRALAEADAAAEAVIGVGIAFTASTVLPVLRDGTPLCHVPEFRGNKHAYVKAWKHHAAQDKASRITCLAAERQEPFLGRYGGKVSSEWLFPKLWQLVDEAPEVCQAMDRFMEAADWIVMLLTGQERRNSCAAGYKAFWNKRQDDPGSAFFEALDPRLRQAAAAKLPQVIYPSGSRAGGITPEAARLTGLLPGTPVAVGLVDAHAAAPACGITDEGQLLMIMGTSTCHLLLGKKALPAEGICGVVEDGIMPGFFGYEAGQPCVGDMLDWFVKTAVPAEVQQAARDRRLSVHQLLREEASRQRPGAHGLLALDWWNGNRSILNDGDLSGLLLGLSLMTRPADIYRALIEATAFGTRLIINQYRTAGLPVGTLYACGGIARKDPFMMQVYADVLGKPIHVAASSQTVALGAAMHGAVAAGRDRGGFADIGTAARDLPQPPAAVYQPDPADAARYDPLYKAYCLLHDTFGRGTLQVMKQLRKIRSDVRAQHEDRSEPDVD